jgi:hypothetical protein
LDHYEQYRLSITIDRITVITLELFSVDTGIVCNGCKNRDLLGLVGVDARHGKNERAFGGNSVWYFWHFFVLELRPGFGYIGLSREPCNT